MRPLIAGLLSAGLLLSTATSGAQQPGTGVHGVFASASQAADNAVEARLTSAGEPGQLVSLGASSLESCSFFGSLAVSEVTDFLGSTPFVVGEIDPDSDRFTLVVCLAPVFLGATFQVWPEGDPLPAPVAGWLGREALARAEVPTPVGQASPNGTDVPYLVNLATWWWFDDADWQTRSGTAALGQWSITASLTPTTSTWSVDGAPLAVCGRGTPYEDGGEHRPGWCGTTFTDIGRDLDQTVTVTYDVTFSCVPAAMCADVAPVPPITVASTTSVGIIQAKGVILR